MESIDFQLASFYSTRIQPTFEAYATRLGRIEKTLYDDKDGIVPQNNTQTVLLAIIAGAQVLTTIAIFVIGILVGVLLARGP